MRLPTARSILAAHGVDLKAASQLMGSWILVLAGYALALPKIDPGIIEVSRPLEATGTVLLIMPALLTVQPLHCNPTWMLATSRIKAQTYRLVTFLVTAALESAVALGFLALLHGFPLAQGFCAWVFLASLLCVLWCLAGSTVAILLTFLVIATLSINGVVPWAYNVVYNDASVFDLRIVSVALVGAALSVYVWVPRGSRSRARGSR